MSVEIRLFHLPGSLVPRRTGRVGSGRVGSGRVGSGRVGSGRVGSGRAGSSQMTTPTKILTQPDPTRKTSKPDDPTGP